MTNNGRRRTRRTEVKLSLIPYRNRWSQRDTSSQTDTKCSKLTTDVYTNTHVASVLNNDKEISGTLYYLRAIVPTPLQPEFPMMLIKTFEAIHLKKTARNVRSLWRRWRSSKSCSCDIVYLDIAAQGFKASCCFDRSHPVVLYNATVIYSIKTQRIYIYIIITTNFATCFGSLNHL